MKSFLTGTKTPISIFSVSVKPSESVGKAVVVPFGSSVVKTRYPQTVCPLTDPKTKLIVYGYLVEDSHVVVPVLSVGIVVSIDLN